MDTLFLDYENSLISDDKRSIRDYEFYGTEPGGMNQQRALSVIRYALEKVLEWDVETAVQKFDDYIIRIMKLDQFTRFIYYPVEIPENDPRYILSLLYPDKVKINYNQLVVSLFENVIEKNMQFPREYFMGVDGYFRYCICLQYLIESYHPVHSIDEMYQFILSPKGNSFLTEYRLKVPAEQLQIDVLDCIHEITKDLPDANLYYTYYSFVRERNRRIEVEYMLEMGLFEAYLEICNQTP